MKKKILTLILGCLFIGVNAYAAGDLQVNGNLGVGTAPATKMKATVLTTNTRGMEVTATMNQNGIVPADILQGLTLKAEMTGSATGDTQGINLLSVISTTADSANSGTGGSFILSLANSSSGTTSINQTVAGKFDTLLNPGNRNYNVTQGYGFDLILRDNRNTGSGSLFFNNFKNININNASNAYGALSVNSLSGIWIDKQTLGSTSNYGIVLNGDGTGADIVFGTSNNVKLYANAGDLYVKDAANNVTQIGPHDTETGEWIFYSKNIKTGRTVRVNMEQLVKAVEKITGEKFMIESIEEIN